MTELDTLLSHSDLVDAHKMLDALDDWEYRTHLEQQKAQAPKRSR